MIMETWEDELGELNTADFAISEMPKDCSTSIESIMEYLVDYVKRNGDKLHPPSNKGRTASNKNKKKKTKLQRFADRMRKQFGRAAHLRNRGRVTKADGVVQSILEEPSQGGSTSRQLCCRAPQRMEEELFALGSIERIISVFRIFKVTCHATQMLRVQWDLTKILEIFHHREDDTIIFKACCHVFRKMYRVEEVDLTIILEHILLCEETTTDISWALVETIIFPESPQTDRLLSILDASYHQKDLQTSKLTSLVGTVSTC